MLHFKECRKKCNTVFGFSIFSHKNQSIKLLPKNLIYRNITTPSLSYAHEHCRNPKKISKKVATLEKTTVLYRSNTLICLCLQFTCSHLPCSHNHRKIIHVDGQSAIAVIVFSQKMTFLIPCLMGSLSTHTKRQFFEVQ